MLFLGWTLNYEMFFYTVFALSLLLGRWSLIYTCAGISILVMLGRFLHSDSVIWQFYTNPIVLEFVLGVSLFLLYKHRPELVSKSGRWWTVSLVVILLWVWDEIPIFRDFAPAIISFFLVGAMLGFSFSSWRIVPMLVLLGDASYSLYLSHPYIIRILSKISIAHQNYGPLDCNLGRNRCSIDRAFGSALPYIRAPDADVDPRGNVSACPQPVKYQSSEPRVGEDVDSRWRRKVRAALTNSIGTSFSRSSTPVAGNEEFAPLGGAQPVSGPVLLSAHQWGSATATATTPASAR